MTDTYTPVLTPENLLKISTELGLTGYSSVFARAIERAAIEAYQRQQWQHISTAPTDGTEILLADDEENQAVMRWDPAMRNSVFGDAKGFWACPSRNFTWDHRGKFGPTKWKRLPTPPEQQ